MKIFTKLMQKIFTKLLMHENIYKINARKYSQN